MPQPKNYILLKQLLDTYGQTEFLKSYGTLEDLHYIQKLVIYTACKYYDTFVPAETQKK